MHKQVYPGFAESENACELQVWLLANRDTLTLEQFDELNAIYHQLDTELLIYETED